MYKKGNSIGGSLNFMSNFMDEKIRLWLLIEINYIQIGKSQCTVMHNNFINKTLNEDRRSKYHAG